MVEINSIFPAIEQSRYSDVNSQRLIFMVGGAVVLILFVLTLILFVNLNAKSKEIRKSNELLARVNSLLKETSAIKDQYIMQSLHGNTSFVNNVEKESLAAIRKITTRQFEDAKAILYNIDIKEERERIYAAFDTAFLALFPNFIEAFNSLMNEDARISLDKSGALPMEVRIFALMRLGIDDPAQVADYLHLSVNTIYVYKNKIKSKASVSKEQFDALVMAISK
jgi:DNA-binding CsgD family transcriptional regulator